MYAAPRIVLVGFVALAAVPLRLFAADPPQAAAYSFSGGDGSTLNAAVIVHAKDESVGTDAEYAWIKEHWPGSRRSRQELITKNNKLFDALTITDSAGQERTLYFDITEYFGKL